MAFRASFAKGKRGCVTLKVRFMPFAVPSPRVHSRQSVR
jgi:hypothetical protein